MTCNEARHYATLAIEQLKQLIDQIKLQDGSGGYSNDIVRARPEDDFAWTVVEMAYDDDQK